MSKGTGFNKPDAFSDMKLIEIQEIENDPNVYLVYKSKDPNNSKMMILKQRHSNQQDFDDYNAANAVIDFAKKGNLNE